MAQTAEQRKINRLEKQVADLKNEVNDLQTKLRKQEREVMIERQWRMDFQRLMKDVVHSDTVDDEWF